MRLRREDFEMVVALVDHKTQSKAAEKLFTTQQTVSRHLLGLEALVGVQLFERTPHGMTPTLAGEVFYDFAKGGLAYFHGAEELLFGDRQMPLPGMRLPEVGEPENKHKGMP